MEKEDEKKSIIFMRTLIRDEDPFKTKWKWEKNKYMTACCTRPDTHKSQDECAAGTDAVASDATARTIKYKTHMNLISIHIASRELVYGVNVMLVADWDIELYMYRCRVDSPRIRLMVGGRGGNFLKWYFHFLFCNFNLQPPPGRKIGFLR